MTVDITGAHEPIDILYLSGASGWVGSAISRAAEARGIAVHAIGRAGELQVECRGSSAIFCHAAWPDLPGSRDGSAHVETNARWLAFFHRSRVLQAAAMAAGLRQVTIGSGVETVDPKLLLGGYGDYVARKKCLRNALFAVDPSSCWLRLHNLFGAGERAERLVPAAILAAQERKSFATGPLGRTRHWLDIDDAASALIAMISDAPAGEWDIAGAEPISFADLFEMIGEVAGQTLELVETSTPTADSRIAAVPPSRPWPGQPCGIGTREQLRGRLQSYARSLCIR